MMDLAYSVPDTAAASPAPSPLHSASPAPFRPVLASTPSSNVCPLAPKPLPTAVLAPAVAANGAQVSGIVTQKEWVVPPRPKVGSPSCFASASNRNAGLGYQLS